MITIHCTNCQAELTMDEAFAGGVCRCQFCGTIQTVPKATRPGEAGGESSGIVAQAGGSSQRTLWRQKTASEATPGTGLDDLADIVASSGLAGSGLQSKRLRKSAPPTDPEAIRKKKRMQLFGALGGAVAAVLLLGLFLIKAHTGGGETPTDNTTPGVGTPDTPSIPVVTGPSFAGVKLDSAGTVVYILDSGQGTSNVFTDLKTITLKSIQSLTADRKFQIVFWQIRGSVTTYPESGATVAGDISINEATRKLDDVTAFGSSTIGPALQKAAAVNPDTIIIATGKGEDLDDSFVTEVNANKPPGAKIYAFAMGNDHPIKPLQQVASQNGGEYRTISDPQVRAMAR